VTNETEPMTDSDTDPTLRDLAPAATRTSDAAAEWLASLTALAHSVRAANAAGCSTMGIGKVLRRGRSTARLRRAQNRIRPSARLAAHSAEVIAAAVSFGLTNVRVFGSCVRGEANLASDVDLLVDISELTSLIDIIRFATVVEDVLTLEEGRVDVLTGDALRPDAGRAGERIAAEAQPLAAWAAGLLPRLESLPAAARRSCVLEILATARACAAVGRFERLTIALAAWKGTAEAYADPTIALDGSDLDYLDE